MAHPNRTPAAATTVNALQIAAAAAWITATLAAPTPVGGLAAGIAVSITIAALIERARLDRETNIAYGAAIQAGR